MAANNILVFMVLLFSHVRSLIIGRGASIWPAAVTFSQPGKSKIQAQTKSAIEKFARRSLLNSLSFRDCELFAMRSREPHLRAGTAPDG